MFGWANVSQGRKSIRKVKKWVLKAAKQKYNKQTGPTGRQKDTQKNKKEVWMKNKKSKEPQKVIWSKVRLQDREIEDNGKVLCSLTFKELGPQRFTNRSLETGVKEDAAAYIFKEWENFWMKYNKLLKVDNKKKPITSFRKMLDKFWTKFFCWPFGIF